MKLFNMLLTPLKFVKITSILICTVMSLKGEERHFAASI